MAGRARSLFASSVPPGAECQRRGVVSNARRALRYDIIISGAGVAGLWLAQKLTKLGYSVLVLEKSDSLARYASTRNEGWLQGGTYHGAAIPVRDIALRVAPQTLDGFR